MRCRGVDQSHRAGSVSGYAVSQMGVKRAEGHLSISMNVRAGMETARGWSGRRPLYFSTAGFTPVQCRGGEKSYRAGSVSRRAVSRIGATRAEGHLSISMDVRAGWGPHGGGQVGDLCILSWRIISLCDARAWNQSHWAGSVSRHGDRIARANLRSPAG